LLRVSSMLCLASRSVLISPPTQPYVLTSRPVNVLVLACISFSGFGLLS
jgi:hypothetical protein